MDQQQRAALQRAISIVGGQTALAKALGVSQPSVWYWLHKREASLGWETAARIEEVTKGRVMRHEIDPCYGNGKVRRRVATVRAVR